MSEKKQDTVSSGKFKRFIDANWLAVEKGLLDIFGADVHLVDRDTGEIEKRPIPLESRALYFYLTSRINWKTEELDAFPSVKTMAKVTAWSENKVRKHLGILEDVGLIETERTIGGVNHYKIRTMIDSKIYFDRPDGEGYAHKEIKTYIETVKGAMYEISKMADAFIVMIMDIFDTDTITPGEHSKIKAIQNSNLWTRGKLIEYAEQLATEKKGIPDFISTLESEVDKSKVRLVKPIPLYNWLEDREIN